MNFSFFLEDITVSPGYLKEWRIFIMTAVAFRPKKLFKNSYSRQLIINVNVYDQSKRVGHVVPGVVVYLSFHAWVGWVSDLYI